MPAKKLALTVTAKLKDGSTQSLDFELVTLTGDEVDLHGRRITSMLRSVGGDVEIVQYAINKSANASKRWTAQIDNGKTKFMVSGAYKTQKATLPDVRFYMRAYQGRLK